MKCKLSEAPLHSFSSEQTHAFGKALAKSLPEKAILLFTGDLGAGKTTLIKGIADGLGIDPRHITSPTFTLLHLYEGEKPLFHFDLYRLENAAEFELLGFAEMLLQKGIFCIEWPERIAHLSLPKSEIWKVELSHLKGDERLICVQLYERN